MRYTIASALYFPTNFSKAKFLQGAILTTLTQSEKLLKSTEEMNLQITDRMMIEWEIQKMMKEIMENPKK